jgi:hypothetical protein
MVLYVFIRLKSYYFLNRLEANPIIPSANIAKVEGSGTLVILKSEALTVSPV